MVPFMLSHVNAHQLSEAERKYLGMLRLWTYRNDPDENGPTVFMAWLDALENEIWADDFKNLPQPTQRPASFSLMEALKKDSAFRFIDNIETPEKESLAQVVTASFKKAVAALTVIEREQRLPWSRFKDAGIRHLLRMEQLSRYHLRTGGGEHIINATKQFHGPSWKMIVHLTDETEAYGIYPGGQTGNPGSRRYDEFVDDWAAGKYYRLWLMKKNQSADKRVKGVWKVSGER